MRELSLNVMDIAQNSIRAGAMLTTISVEESVPEGKMIITITDNGCGMSEEQVKSVIDPFFTTRTTRKVGLGVPLFKMEAEMTGGKFDISSEVGVGTTLSAEFNTSHVDMIPLGDIGAVMHLLITCNPDIDFEYIRRRVNADGEEKLLKLDTRDIREQLGDIPFSQPDVSEWIREYIAEMESELQF